MNRSLLICIAFLGICLTLPADKAISNKIILDDFGKASEPLWKMRVGNNINYSSTFGEKVKIGEKEETVLKLEFEKKDVTNKKPPENWFSIGKAVEPNASWKSASAIKIDLSVKNSGQWWLQLNLMSDGEKFSKVLMPCNYNSNIIQDRVLTFKDFKNKNGKKIAPEKISRINITGSALCKILYINKMLLLSNKETEHFVKFTTNEAGLNIFQPGQTVEMTFAIGNSGAPQNAKGIEYEINDYFNRNVKKGKIELSKNKEYTAEFKPALPGYYDAKAYWVDASNKRLSESSCIKTTGSLEHGRGTFAVMPNTLDQNLKRMKEFGDKAFFGFHGNSGNLVDLMGMTWRLGCGGRWIWDEKKEKPKIIDGTAEWAKEKLTKKPDQKLGLYGIFNQCMNISQNLPDWAKSNPLGKAPGLKDPDEYFRYLKDRIKVNKHSYPHMKRRIYDIFWEVNLNKPKIGTHKPTYLPSDIIEAYQKARKVLDSEDPGAILAGPCTSALKELPWVESLLKGGLLKYLDAYNCHGYHTPPPEEGQVVGKIRELKAMLKKYNNGKMPDIYCTELGYRSQYGSKDRHKEHAQWHTRVAIILKGEGLKVYYPFYSYDYVGDNETWGVCYNLSPRMAWGPKHVSPKAAVPALAVCANELEGTSPVSDLPFFGRDIWCYIFKDNKSGKPIIAIWSVHDKHKIKFPAGNVNSLEITNIMGHHSEIAVKDGLAVINVSPSPIYIKGALKNIYINDKKAEDNILTKLYPGEKKTVKPPAPLTKSIQFWGDADIKTSNGMLHISIPADCQPGPIPVLFGNKTKWLAVKEPLEIVKVSLEKKKSGMEIELALNNRGIVDLPASVSLEIPGKAPREIKETLKSKSKTTLSLPLKLNGEINFSKPLNVCLKINAGNLREIKTNKQFSFLAAHLRGEPNEDKLPNSIEWGGKGSSGKEDKAKIYFEWDEKNLYLKIEAADDVFHQTRNDGTIWQMDSLQIAFDTHPELNAVYAPLAGVFTKKITEIAIARTPEKNLAWRHATHNEEELKLGDIPDAMDIDIVRDENKKLTIYNLSIPWKEIGLDSVGKGKPIGIAILLNDSDGKDSQRTGLELFSGIMRGKDHRLYGMITLR